MKSPDIVVLSLSALGGVFIGIVFFGALWWTVSCGLRSKRPAPLFFLSFLGRTIFALAGFYIVGSSHPGQLIACLLGFLGGRILIGWFLPANTIKGNLASSGQAKSSGVVLAL